MSNIGAIPSYVPPHLQDKVFDFKNEDDGTVSFSHPEAAPGLMPHESRVRLSKEQYEDTFSNTHRLGDLKASMINQYAPMQRRGETGPRQHNNTIGRALRGAFDWGTTTQGKGIATAGLLSALAGGAGGYLLGKKMGGGSLSKSMLLALLAGGIGAGSTAWAQNRHNKQEAAFMNKNASSYDPSYDIIRLLEGDPTIGGSEKYRILRAAAKLGESDQARMSRLMSTSVGAGAGVLAARFLGAKGLLPMLAGGILGGLLGRRNL